MSKGLNYNFWVNTQEQIGNNFNKPYYIYGCFPNHTNYMYQIYLKSVPKEERCFFQVANPVKPMCEYYDFDYDLTKHEEKLSAEDLFIRFEGLHKKWRTHLLDEYDITVW
jgi:hypothetical protein